MVRTLVRSLSLVAILAGTAAAAGDPLPAESPGKVETTKKTVKKKAQHKAKKKAARKSQKKKQKKAAKKAARAAERRPTP